MGPFEPIIFALVSSAVLLLVTRRKDSLFQRVEAILQNGQNLIGDINWPAWRALCHPAALGLQLRDLECQVETKAICPPPAC